MPHEDTTDTDHRRPPSSVHTAFGAGLLESAYEACLAHEFARHGLHFEHQVTLPVVYEGFA